VEAVCGTVEGVQDEDEGEEGEESVGDEGQADAEPKVVAGRVLAGPNFPMDIPGGQMEWGDIRRVFPICSVPVLFGLPPCFQHGIFDTDEDDED
jgi:hypothetical protein